MIQCSQTPIQVIDKGLIEHAGKYERGLFADEECR